MSLHICVGHCCHSTGNDSVQIFTAAESPIHLARPGSTALENHLLGGSLFPFPKAKTDVCVRRGSGNLVADFVCLRISRAWGLRGDIQKFR